MCGTCGFSFEDKKLLKQMTDEIKHRGPNAEGHFVDKGISLGSRRLSIIDLSAAGNQPIYNEDKSIALVYNGELFNFIELREELKKKRHKFVSGSDSEVVVHAYEEYGADCVKKFNGFWGFALYDSRKRLLFISRDRIGLKPMYYFFEKGKFIFGSELKVILLDKSVPRIIDKSALGSYFTYRYIPSELTIFQNIKKLKPGHNIIFDLKKKELKIEKYWDIGINIQSAPENTVSENIISLLKDSVKRRMISDVPLGVYLSGGIDSSSIVAMMKSFTDDITTYSLSFEHDKIGNEMSYAKNVADHFGTRHNEISISTDIIKDLPGMVWHLDEPMADPAAVPVYYLSREAKKDVTVILTGDGADELFAGYSQYKFLLLAEKMKNMPRPLKRMIPPSARLIPKALLNKFYSYSEATGEKMFDRLGKLLDDIKDNRAKSYADVVSVFDDDEKRQLLKFAHENDYASLNSEYFSKNDFLTQITHFDAKNYLPEDLLMKPDKMCMAWGVEARVPYLDYRLVEYSFTIPSNLKLRGSVSKYILKKALKGHIPDEIIHRKKQPFQMPLNEWMSKGLKDHFHSLIMENLDSECIEKGFVQKIFENYSKSKLYYGRQIWSLGIFATWKKLFVDKIE